MKNKIKEFINYINLNFKTSIWGIQEIKNTQFIFNEEKQIIEFYITYKTEDYKTCANWSVPSKKFMDKSIKNLFYFYRKKLKGIIIPEKKGEK